MRSGPISKNRRKGEYVAENKKEKGTAEYVPASSNPKGNSDTITKEYNDSLLIEYRHMGNAVPATSAELLGQKLTTPIMAGAIALLGKIKPEGARGYAEGVRKAGTIMWTGWMDDEEFKSAADTGVKIVRGIKPFEDEDKIFHSIEVAEQAGAIGVFMDIDHCFNDAGLDCEFAFGKLSHKSLEQLASYVKAAKVPFIFKGIMSPEDVRKCIEVGAKAIVVSHHKGIWSYSVPPLYILPEIKKAAEGKLEVFTDCGLKNGVDVFKALARGADGACTARSLLAAYAKGGTEGVADFLKEMNDELRGTMAKTGSADIKGIDPAVIHQRTW